MQATEYMMIALELAEKGRGNASPNPMVGAILVKDNKIIGQGYHEQYGKAHAEVNAIKNATESVEGATIYVTLEPCSHYGKTPPCANLLIESGIKEVYIGALDPNPAVNGKGVNLLKNAGIIVHTGIAKEACEKINEGFFTRILKNKPLYTTKIAMSLDGKIATKTGQSKWITNENARKFGHGLRAKHDAILVGIGTILADDPQLNCRVAEFQPDCIVLDTNARTPLNSKIFDTKEREVHIFVGENAAKSNIEALKEKGAIVHIVQNNDKGLSLKAVNDVLFNIGYVSVLIEGGSSVNASFIEEKLVDKIWVFIGDKIIGGKNATPALTGEGISKLEESLVITYKDVYIKDNNIYLLAEVKES